MSEPVVSVVMPCLNGMPHLPRALQSVHAAFPGAIAEIVVADGGSTDGSLDLLRSSGVRLLEGPDASLYDGLNRAIAAARAPYLVWLNTDDVLLPDVAALLARARDDDADIATGEAEIVRDGAVSWSSDHASRKADTASLLFGVPTINSRVLSRRIMDRIGPFRTDIGLGADRHMLVRLFSQSPRRASLERPVYRYEAHAGSRTMAGNWRSYRDTHEANLAMARALRDDPLPQADRAALEAFECAAALAAARSSLPGGGGFSGLRPLAATLVRRPLPGPWLQGLKLRGLHRGRASGW